mmetsp:Transcript_7064/g.21716  ORF Transcript_7064/g.21716 Transcript_7064/m.21716 type:complete len:192 (-) Transcript_7064:168-743(-)
MLPLLVHLLSFTGHQLLVSMHTIRDSRGQAPWLQAAKQDPMRPANPPIEPLMINAIQDMLMSSNPDGVAIAERALAARSADPDYQLTNEEASLLRSRIGGVTATSEALVHLIQAAVDANPWVTKFGATKDFGIGELSDPYVRMCRAECMLAAFVIICEDGDVNFVDEDRLEVLRDAPEEAVNAVKISLSIS